MRVLAIDPGINECSYAILDDGGKLIEAGLIPNPYRTKGKVEKLKKASMMCLALRNKLTILPAVDLTMIESTTGSSGGLKNFNTMCRMALVSGCAYGSCDSTYVDFVHPPTWKLVKNKEENIKLFLQDLSEAEWAALDVYLDEVTPSKQHNVLDAYCIALWAYNNF